MHFPANHADHVRLRGDIEHGGRLVQDQKPRTEQHAFRDADTLCLAA